MKNKYITPSLEAVKLTSPLMVDPTSLPIKKNEDDVVDNETSVWSHSWDGSIFDEEETDQY